MYKSEQLSLVRQSAKDFAERYIRPHVMEWDEAQTFPVELMRQLGEQSLISLLLNIPPSQPFHAQTWRFYET